jgi:hypothetical protein
MDRLVDDIIGSESASQTFLETELSEVEEQMRDLGDLAGRMRAAAKVCNPILAGDSSETRPPRTVSINCSISSRDRDFGPFWRMFIEGYHICLMTMVMPKPKRRTWFVSGLSRAGHPWWMATRYALADFVNGASLIRVSITGHPDRKQLSKLL